MTGNFSPNNNSPELKSSQITCTVEASGLLSHEDIISHLERLPFSPKLLKIHHSSASYIVNSTITSEAINTLAEHLEKFNIYLCGRFAEWKYFNMDAAIESAMHLTETICKKVK